MSRSRLTGNGPPKNWNNTLIGCQSSFSRMSICIAWRKWAESITKMASITRMAYEHAPNSFSTIWGTLFQELESRNFAPSQSSSGFHFLRVAILLVYYCNIEYPSTRIISTLVCWQNYKLLYISTCTLIITYYWVTTLITTTSTAAGFGPSLGKSLD